MSNHKNQENFKKYPSERTSDRNSITPKAINNKPNRLIAEQLQKDKDVLQVSATVVVDFLFYILLNQAG